jgi:transposase
MPAVRKYPAGLRERAMRLVCEAREQDPGLSMNAAVMRIGQRVGVHRDTLRGWVRQADVDAGRRPTRTHQFPSARLIGEIGRRASPRAANVG